MKAVSLNYGWTFWNERTPDKKTSVDIPHDAMLTEKRLPGIANGAASAFFPGGKYVYTRELDWDDATETALLEFEGVYQKPSVYLNGKLAGGTVYGYTGFYIDLTGKLVKGRNTITVNVDNSQTPNSRWYSGSGIYRDVRLWTAAKSHIVPDGVKVVTKLEDGEPVAFVTTEVKNAPDGSIVSVEILDVGELMGCGMGTNCRIPLKGIGLWSAEEPKLYTVRVTLSMGDRLLDEHSFKTGFRVLDWSAENGMTVNGSRVLLRGGCIHHEHGLLGAANYRTAVVRKVRKMKELGFNAIRFAHNPSDKTILQVCDELGMYFMDESFDMWQMKKQPYDFGLYFDKHWDEVITAMVRKDWSHPCVVMYSIGNEISDVGQPSGAEITRMLVDRCRELDASRPTVNAINPVVAAMGAINKDTVTENDVVDPYKESKNSALTASLLANMIATTAPFISRLMGKPGKVEKTVGPSMAPLDIVGYNYAENCYIPHHEWNPGRIMVGSETYPARGYDNYELMKTHSYIIGDFVWTAWDYLGEVGLGSPIYGKRRGGFNRPFPCIHSVSGYIDLLGNVDAQGAYAAAVWGTAKKPYIGVRPVDQSGKKYYLGAWRHTDATASWSWDGCEGRKAEIVVYSQGAEAELILNGVSQARKPLCKCKADFTLPYEPGALEAVVYDANGAERGRSSLRSAIGRNTLAVKPEEENVSAGRGNLVYVNISVEGENGELRPLRNTELQVTVEGAGELAALGTADAFPTGSYLDDHCRTFRGRMQAIIKTTGERGEIRVTVRSNNGYEKSCVIEAV